MKVWNKNKCHRKETNYTKLTNVMRVRWFPQPLWFNKLINAKS